MTGGIDRREFLARGAAFAAAVGLGPVLAACGSSKTSGSANLGKASYQLSWLKNIQFAGSYAADKNGYYKAEGLSGVDLLAGGPNVTIEPKVVSGTVFVANSQPDFTAAALSQGASLTIVGAQYQKTPFGLMSMAASPITSPQEMIGKRIGSATTNTIVWQSFLKLNNIDPSQLTTVPVQFDPLPLTTGEVDAWVCFFIDEPNILRSKGFDVNVFSFDQFKFTNFAQVYVVRPDTLDKDRDKLKAFLRAEIRGWQWVIAHPEDAAALAVNVYGKDLGLDLKEQTLEIKDQNTLLVTDSTRANGLFKMDADRIAGAVQTMAAGGITGIDAKALFTNDLLDEIYKDDPSLKVLQA
jgi:ABC-type nitrate/sulfonate/bicarbonate transport system substrate-binding protein